MTLGSLAIGAAGTVANSVGQMNAANKQEQEYDKWVDYQKRIREQENQRQEEFRQKAETARAQGVEDISAQNQTKEQADEAARLADLYSEQGAVTPTAVPIAAADAALAGQQGASGEFHEDLARRLADATRSAKDRIGALAAVSSFGNSFGGLGTVNPINQAKAGSVIDQFNEERRGSLAAYNTEAALQPKQISYSNPFGDIASSLLGFGAQGLGKQLGSGGISSIFSNTVKPKVKAPVGTGGLLGHV